MKKSNLIIVLIMASMLSLFGQQQIPVQRHQINSKRVYSSITQKNLKAITEDFGTTPDLAWDYQFGGSGYDYPESILTDDNNNIYLAGSFSGEITIDDTSYTSDGIRNGFISKYDNAGNLLWFVQLNSTNTSESSLLDMAFTSDGNIIAGGYFTDSTTIGDSTYSTTNNFAPLIYKIGVDGSFISSDIPFTGQNEAIIGVETDTENNIYLVSSDDISEVEKYNSKLTKLSENYSSIWSQYYDETIRDIGIYNDSIYIAGSATKNNDGDFNGMPYNIASFNSTIFISKMNIDGSAGWIKPVNSTYSTTRNPHINISTNGNFGLGGYFMGTVNFDGQSFTGFGGFLGMYNSNGACQWVKPLGTNAVKVTSDSNNGYYASALDTIKRYDNTGNVLWSKANNSYADVLGKNSNDDLIISSSNFGKLKLAKYNNSGIEQFNNQSEGNSASINIYGAADDNASNIYLYAYTSNDIDFKGVTVKEGSFLCKISKNGELQWLKNFEGLHIENLIDRIIHYNPADQNITIAGIYTDELIIPDAPNLPANDTNNGFALIYDSNGNHVASIYDNTSATLKNLMGISVSCDNEGNIILSGAYSQSTNGFIAKYNITGQEQWQIQAQANEVIYNIITSVDQNNNLYISGEFDGTEIILGDSTLNLSMDAGDILVSKITSNGTIEWIKMFGDAVVPNSYQNYYCWPTGIRNDNEGNIYIKGWHGDNVYFGDEILVSPYGSFSKFISKIDTNGNKVWVKSIYEHAPGFDYNSFDLDNNGNVYLGAMMKDSIHFENTFDYGPTNHDLYFAKYNTNGELQWVKTLPSNNEDNFIKSVSALNEDQVFVTGNFNFSLTIDDNQLSSKNTHGFLSYFDNNFNNIIDIYNKSEQNFSIYPNPSKGSINLQLNDNSDAYVEIYDISGKQHYSYQVNQTNSTLDISKLSSGTYIIKVQQNGRISSQKLMVN